MVHFIVYFMVHFGYPAFRGKTDSKFLTVNDSFRVPILSPYIEGVPFIPPSLATSFITIDGVTFRDVILYEAVFHRVIFPFVAGGVNVLFIPL